MGSTKKWLQSSGRRSRRSDEVLEKRRPNYSLELRAPIQTSCDQKFSSGRFFLLRNIRCDNNLVYDLIKEIAAQESLS